jgi:hypothetical protein
MTEKQVPNKVIAVLIVVALLVTIISTWIVLLKIDSINSANQKQSIEKVARGNLAVTILPHANTKNTKMTGQVTLNIE